MGFTVTLPPPRACFKGHRGTALRYITHDGEVIGPWCQQCESEWKAAQWPTVPIEESK